MLMRRSLSRCDGYHRESSPGSTSFIRIKSTQYRPNDGYPDKLSIPFFHTNGSVFQLSSFTHSSSPESTLQQWSFPPDVSAAHPSSEHNFDLSDVKTTVKGGGISVKRDIEMKSADFI